MKSTQELIAGMKAQTFGVEVEGNNITREHAAKVAAEFFGTNHYANTAAVDGYYTWSAWDQHGRQWKFSRDVSIHGPDDEKCELVTPILTYEDLEMFLELLRQLRHAGMKSCPAWIDQERTNRYCRTVSPDFLIRLNAEKPKTMEALRKIWYEGNHANYGTMQHYNDSRYHMLNLHASFTKGTVEFRLFQFDNPHDGKQGGIRRIFRHRKEKKDRISDCRNRISGMMQRVNRDRGNKKSPSNHLLGQEFPAVPPGLV